MTQRLRNFCFTKNNYTEEDIEKIKAFDCKYLVFGREIAPTTGTPHLQGYCELNNQLRKSTLQPIFGHISEAKGNAKQNLEYCSKVDKNYFESGTPKEQGKRNDIIPVVEMMKEKKTVEEIAKANPMFYMRYHNGLEKLHSFYMEPRKTRPDVYWYYGLTGVGKTERAQKMCGENYYPKDGTKWWDKYQNNHGILVDDFNGLWEFRDFLRFLDKNPYKGEYKGGYYEINSPVICITCEFPPEHFWQGNKLSQVVRRIKEVVHVISWTESVTRKYDSNVVEGVIISPSTEVNMSDM